MQTAGYFGPFYGPLSEGPSRIDLKPVFNHAWFQESQEPLQD